MLSDLKLAIRQLRKSPGFTLTAIATLALGIGANAVVFSVLNAVVLKPLNVPEAQNVYTLQRFQYASQSYPDYLDLRDRNRTFESLMAYQIIGAVGVNSGRGVPSTAWPYLASGNYFDGLGIQPYLGRFFHASDEKGANSAPYIVLSYTYWRGHFLGDKSVVGRKVDINKQPFTILGVAPPSFRGTELFFAPAMWIPIVEEPTVMGNDQLHNRSNHSPFVIGRLKPGITSAEATADLNSIGMWLSKTYPGDNDGVKFTLARPGLVGDMLGGPARAFMGGLMLLAGLILLAACANLGSLFAARASDRGKEVALRLALGSGRGLILRQLLTEAVLVSLVGGSVPFIDLIDVVASAVQSYERVGLLATGYTMTSDMYPKRLAGFGTGVLVPDEADRDTVHGIIYRELVHGVVTDESRAAYRDVMARLVEQVRKRSCWRAPRSTCSSGRTTRPSPSMTRPRCTAASSPIS